MKNESELGEGGTERGDGFHLELKRRMGQRATELHKVDGGFVSQLAVVAAQFAREQVAKFNCQPQSRPACPITRREWFMDLEHDELGEVPTYGGPFDSYTVPYVDDDGDLRCERYDHDEGAWVEGGEPLGVWLTTEQPFNKDLPPWLERHSKPDTSAASGHSIVSTESSLPAQPEPSSSASSEAEKVRATKPYEQHLYERLQTLEECVGYLDACRQEGGPKLFAFAVRDVINANRFAPSGQRAVWDVVEIANAVQNDNDLEDGGFFEAGFIAAKTKILDALIEARDSATPTPIGYDLATLEAAAKIAKSAKDTVQGYLQIATDGESKSMLMWKGDIAAEIESAIRSLAITPKEEDHGKS